MNTAGDTAELQQTTDKERRVGAKLREKILDPCLTPIREHPAVVHIVLDDALHLVPFEALPQAEGRLGDSLSLRFEVSARRIMASVRDTVKTGTLLAFGGIDFGAGKVADPVLPSRGIGSVSGDLSFSVLPGTLLEAEAVGDIFSKHFGAKPVVISGRKASKQELYSLAPDARYLHVATHGWFAPETLESMLDLLPDPSGRSFVRTGETVRGFAPETLCGLALAGANRGALGILTAEELSTLDLSNCELAVLSACETNVGIHRAGQGIQSLQGALHAAGARTAITSLWRVDDAATRHLMEIFYTKLWGDGLGKAEALWQAKMAMRAEGHPIYHWAGWVLTGDPE